MEIRKGESPLKYTRFEELPVWQASMELAEGMFELTADRAFRRQGDLANQLQRAGLSISNNIAEGFERGTNAELITFLYYARGSAAEVRSMLLLTDRLSRFSHLKSPISNLQSLSESISRQLRAWADPLQNSSIKGQRHLTDHVRARNDARSRRETFQARIQQMADKSRRAGQSGPESPPS